MRTLILKLECGTILGAISGPEKGEELSPEQEVAFFGLLDQHRDKSTVVEIYAADGQLDSRWTRKSTKKSILPSC